jgi:hypothetical protein
MGETVSGLMELEFRENSSVEDVILLGLRILPRNGLKNRSTSVYSENRYWISMKSKGRPRLATAEEWNGASEIELSHGRCLDCKQAENHAVLFGPWRFVPSHSDRHSWVWVRPYESPDGKWLLVDSWSGQQFRTGSDWFTGGHMGARGYSYFDIFNLRSGKKAMVFGGYRDNTKSDVTGFFLGTRHQPFWLAPHYLVGDFTEKEHSFMFCNPELAPQ